MMSFSGTSAAAPLVAGAIASVASSDPQLTLSEAATLLEQYADYKGPYSTTGSNEFYGSGVIDVARVLNRNDLTLADVAMADTFLDLSGVSTTTPADSSATAPLQVLVQNRGNVAFAGSQLTIDIGGQPSEHLLGSLAPNEVKEVTVNVPVSQLEGAGVIINANVQGQGLQDVNPINNTLSKVLHITIPSTSTTTSP